MDSKTISDEEIRLINEVDELQSKLSHAGDPIDPKLSESIYSSIRTKSTAAERVPKWSLRVTYLETKVGKSFCKRSCFASRRSS